MSTRFHDKWHGANHNSVSAIGIPDAGRDPIASYVFPFEGEFIMNNSPRNNSGNGHSEFTSATIFDKWILSSNRIDSNIIRSQQDEESAEIVLSAKCGSANRVVQTLHGTDNNYYLEVSGADNSVKFDCAFDPIIDDYKHETHKAIGVSGVVTYTESIDANVPCLEEVLWADSGHVPPEPVPQQDPDNTTTETGDGTETGNGTETGDGTETGGQASDAAEKLSLDEPSNYQKGIRTKKDANSQLVELRITDKEGYCDLPETTDSLWQDVDCAGIDGINHDAYLDIGNLRMDADTSGSITVAGWDTKKKAAENNAILRNSVLVRPGSDGGIFLRHKNRGDETKIEMSGANILVKTNTHDNIGILREETYNHEIAVDNDSKTNVGGDCKSWVQGNREETVTGDKRTNVYDGDLYSTVDHNAHYNTSATETSAGTVWKLYAGSAISAESRDESVYKSDNKFISLETPNPSQAVFFNKNTSVKPHTFANSDGHLGTEMTSDRIVVSAYQSNPPYDYRTIVTGNEIVFENSYGRIPNLNTTNLRAEKAWFTEFEATSGIVHFIDIVQSDVSGFDVLGKEDWGAFSAVPQVIPHDSRLHLASAGLWNDRWMFTSGDATFDRNVLINQSEKINRTVSAETSVEIGKSIGGASADRYADKYVLYVHDSAAIDGDVDVSASIKANGDLTLLGNSHVYGSTELGFGKAEGTNERALSVSGTSLFGGNVSAKKTLTVLGESTFKSPMWTSNITADGFVSASDAVYAPSVSSNLATTNRFVVSTVSAPNTSSPITVISDLNVSNGRKITAPSGNITGSLTANEIVTPHGVAIGKNITFSDGNDYNITIGNDVDMIDCSDSVCISPDNHYGDRHIMSCARNCIVIGTGRMGYLFPEKDNTILIGSGYAEDSNLLQFHNVPFFRFNSTLDGGKLEDTLYSFYDYNPDNLSASVFHFANVSANSLSANEAQITKADLGRTEVHDGLRILGSDGLYLEGNAFVTSALSAREFYIIRNSGEADPLGMMIETEAVPLSTVIDEMVTESVNGKVAGLEERVARSVPVPVFEPADEARSVGSEVVSLAEQVDEAEHVSYVFSAEKIENYCPQNAQSVSMAQDVANAAVVRKADSVSSAAKVGTIEHVDSFLSAGSVETAVSVDYAETAKRIESANMVDTAISIGSVASADVVQDAVEVYNGNVVTKTEFVQEAVSVKKAKTVDVAENVKTIKLFDGNVLRGPAASRVVRCGSEIPVDEWVDYYRTDSTDISLGGEAVGWSEEDYDLSFTVRFVPNEDSLYTISVSADKDIEWVGVDGTTKKFKAPVSVRFRVSKDEITAKLEA